MSKFYTYIQNNSGGSFDLDDNIAQFVIIEANDYLQANKRAKEVGIYFNGCDSGMDCSCCGDRWYELWDESEGFLEPMIFGTPADQYKASSFFEKEYRIHFFNGNIKSRILY